MNTFKVFGIVVGKYLCTGPDLSKNAAAVICENGNAIEYFRAKRHINGHPLKVLVQIIFYHYGKDPYREIQLVSLPYNLFFIVSNQILTNKKSCGPLWLKQQCDRTAGQRVSIPQSGGRR